MHSLAFTFAIKEEKKIVHDNSAGNQIMISSASIESEY